MSCKILGVGGFLPGDPISNEELSKYVDTNDEWIKTRTGIEQRHFTKLSCAEMAEKAATLAINDACISASEIDLIIVCSTTPDRTFPSTATTLQGRLSLSDIPSFDINAVCTGFIYGIELADALFSSRDYNKILLIGVDKMSNVLDMSERATAVLFGDGAGAVVLTKSKNAICETILGSDGSLAEILKTEKYTDNTPSREKIFMQGGRVYRNAVNKMAEMAELVLKKAKISKDEIDYFIPHQANIRIMNAVTEKLSINKDKLVSTVASHANTSAATIPLALNSLKNNKILKSNNKILMSALGSGITYGGAIIEIANEYCNKIRTS